MSTLANPLRWDIEAPYLGIFSLHKANSCRCINVSYHRQSLEAVVEAMPSTSTALRVIVASALAAALTPPQPGRHALQARPQQPGRHALRARPLAAALVETAGLVPDGARHVSEDLVKKTHRFDVSLTEPLGLTLGEAQAGKDTCVYVKTCVEINQCVGCNDDAAVLARSSGEEPASPRHRAGVA